MIDEAAGRAIAAMPKKVMEPLVWIARVNQARRKAATAIVFDMAGATIPGVTVTLEVEAPVVVQSCLFQFTIYKLVHGQRRRAYQLAVCPASKRSHNEPGLSLYGPHEHFGEAAFAVSDPAVTCADWQSCFAWFLIRCNLQAPQIEVP